MMDEAHMHAQIVSTQAATRVCSLELPSIDGGRLEYYTHTRILSYMCTFA